MEYLRLLLECQKSGQFLSKHGYDAPIAEMIATAISDAAQECRAVARNAYWAYHRLVNK